MTALGLGLAAWPIYRISSSHVAASDPENYVLPIAATPETKTAVPIQLQLSAAARQIELLDENAEVLWRTNDAQNTEFFAELQKLPAQIVVKISWSGSPAPRYFAKLRLDVPGRESLIHVFDASGDIDDLWELP